MNTPYDIPNPTDEILIGRFYLCQLSPGVWVLSHLDDAEDQQVFDSLEEGIGALLGAAEGYGFAHAATLRQVAASIGKPAPVPEPEVPPIPADLLAFLHLPVYH